MEARYITSMWNCLTDMESNCLDIASNTICVNIISTMFFSVRYHIWHINRLCLVYKTHFSWFFEWTTPTVYECAFLNFAVYRVFRQFHHRNLIQSSNIYLKHSSRVSICSTTVSLYIISVCGHINIPEDQAKWIWWHHFLIWYQKYSEEVLRKLQHNLWGSILGFLNLDKYSRVWENSLFVAHCPDTFELDIFNCPTWSGSDIPSLKMSILGLDIFACSELFYTVWDQ